VKPAALPLAILLVGLASACGGDDEGGGAEDPSLEGTPWVYASGLDVVGWEEAPPSATFADGRVYGSTGCNGYNADYTLDSDSLVLGPIVATRIACLPPRDEVERAYLAALEEVAAWRIDGEELVLLDADESELLRYATATIVGDWTVTAFLEGNSVSSTISGTDITAAFGEDGTLSGAGGCNTYTATYTTDGTEIEISQPAATQKACAEPAGVMEQEAAYFAALPKAVGYRLDGNILRLLTAQDTIVVTYTRAGS
jgi:heat shock protein HslJ